MGKNSFIKNVFHGIQHRLKISKNKEGARIGWLLTKYYKHLPPGRIRSRKLYGKTLYFYSPTELLHGLKEIFEEEIYKLSLPAEPYIIDCGANIGLSIIYLKQQFPGAEIVAFEPDNTNFDLLSKNIHSFGYSNVTLRKEAVWTENTTLHFSNSGSMSSKIETASNFDTQEVKATRLKDLLIKPIDFLKIDIEGAEYDVLTDIAADLHFVKNMFVEYHGSFRKNNQLTEMLGLIQKAGFSYYIKEAANVYTHPFFRDMRPDHPIPYDLQLNIFCFRT